MNQTKDQISNDIEEIGHKNKNGEFINGRTTTKNGNGRTSDKRRRASKKQQVNKMKKFMNGGGLLYLTIVLLLVICWFQLKESIRVPYVYESSNEEDDDDPLSSSSLSSQYQTNLGYKKLQKPRQLDPDRPRKWIFHEGANVKDPSTAKQINDIIHQHQQQQQQQRRQNHPFLQQNQRLQLQQQLQQQQQPGRKAKKGGTVYPQIETNFKLETYVGSKNKNGNPVKVVVGHQGPAVEASRLYGLAQRNIGSHRSQWDAIGQKNCIQSPGQESNLYQRNDSNTTTSLYDFLPRGILIGVQKGGTTALYSYLDQHPMIQKTGKELYFLDEGFDGVVNKHDGIPQQRGQTMYATMMKQSAERNQLNQMTKKGRLGNVMPSFHNDDGTTVNLFQAGHGKKIIMDCTPNYMFYSDRVPYRIACLTPSVKLLALLRNPIDRARSQYDMKISFAKERSRTTGTRVNHLGNPVPTFDEYVQYDIDALYETGVLQDWNEVDFDEFFHSPACDEAWRTYINSGLNAPVGMGLYALQLKPYMELIKQQQEQNGGDGGMTLLPILSEDLRSKTEETYFRILDFLELPRHKLNEYKVANAAPKTIIRASSSSTTKTTSEHTKQQERQRRRLLQQQQQDGDINNSLRRNTNSTKRLLPGRNIIVAGGNGRNGVGAGTTVVSPTTRILLQEIFEPYNRKLTEYFGKEWENVWS